MFEDGAVSAKKRSKMNPADIEWWFATSAKHSAADEACGRAWVCGCSPCSEGRKVMRATTHYDVILFGTRRVRAYERAMRLAP